MNHGVGSCTFRVLSLKVEVVHFIQVKQCTHRAHLEARSSVSLLLWLAHAVRGAHCHESDERECEVALVTELVVRG